jgi:hypothetical protein
MPSSLFGGFTQRRMVLPTFRDNLLIPSSWVKQPSQGPIRYPETLVINYQSFSVFEGVRRSIQRSVVLGYKNCSKMNLTVVPLEIFPQLWSFWLWAYGLRHRAVCQCHKSGCNLKLVHARQWRVNMDSTPHIMTCKVTASCNHSVPPDQQRQIHIRDLLHQLKRQHSPQKNSNCLSY